MQGHSSPGVYARAFLEGRLPEEQMRNFRTEAYKDGLSSYPHPWLMPDFWQFPTVSMGLGPLMAIYQARFMKYLQGRGLAETAGRKVWAFMGDGEMDEPESLGAISMAGREKLDNLIFVINCNLQRLDGPVRGNGKIIQELETNFRGNGWNVIKTIWGSRWDPLLAADHEGHLLARMNEALDGDYQTYKSRNGAYVREHFFGTKPELREMVKDMSDDQIWALNRGGLDSRKVYAAYKSATEHHGQPTVILAKTIKGYGMGTAGEGQNITHQQKKMNEEALLAFRDRFELELTDEQVRNLSFYKPPEGSPEAEFIREQRAKLGGSLPARRRKAESLPTPELTAFQSQLDGTGDREVSTTMSFVRILQHPAARQAARQADRPDRARRVAHVRHGGPVPPARHLQPARPAVHARRPRPADVLPRGQARPGAAGGHQRGRAPCPRFIAAGTSYSNHGTATIPFYIYYSMFGFQRVGDLAWAAGDSRTRGFLLGGTAGRTTLNGEGLQHEDGHSHLVSATIPNCVSYDPTYGYELAVIIREGLRRMFTEQEDVFYYLTLMNENYQHPAMPEGAEEGILRGLYKLRAGRRG